MMRFSRILIAAALSISAAALNAQATMRLTSVSSVPFTGDWVVYDLEFVLTSQILRSWDSFALRLAYDNTKLEVFFVQDSATQDARIPAGPDGPDGYVSLTSLGSNRSFSTPPVVRIDLAPAVRGTVTGLTNNVTNPGVTDFTIAVSSFRSEFSDTNILFTQSNRAGIPRIPIKVAVNTATVGAGNTVCLTLQDQSFISGGVRYRLSLEGGCFTVVPEPASMVALGGGLMGLLAWRRRKG